jgi:hypothetical protein
MFYLALIVVPELIEAQTIYFLIDKTQQFQLELLELGCVDDALEY